MARKNVNDRGATLWRENEARQKNSSGSGYCPKQILTCIDLQNILTERFQDWTDQDKVPGPGISNLNLGEGGGVAVQSITSSLERLNSVDN